jgi:hypothetical protein
VTNLRVGVKVLQECIARAGSLEGGLRYYVGAANLPDDGGYAAKVLAEHFRLRQVAGRPAAATRCCPPRPRRPPRSPQQPSLPKKKWPCSTATPEFPALARSTVRYTSGARNWR